VPLPLLHLHFGHAAARGRCRGAHAVGADSAQMEFYVFLQLEVARHWRRCAIASLVTLIDLRREDVEGFRCSRERCRKRSNKRRQCAVRAGWRERRQSGALLHVGMMPLCTRARLAIGPWQSCSKDTPSRLTAPPPPELRPALDLQRDFCELEIPPAAAHDITRRRASAPHSRSACSSDAQTAEPDGIHGAHCWSCKH